ncbi:uncharacterized protein C17orf80 homolog [Bufo bufo]|uniref:uncharacterized protein C17orf80 homolog n=1 Tax=Bufo bufo TaxID=8384 RepID=UPI001ABE4058|nr:uncharacterized protein C17orf80 homolog [Bufo bufo]XP_040293716.1 uncharacterized protein C17orf80 homolog [Bufo bufo]
MEVCPFCGKAFKRLKSHLPHCKMAEIKNTAPEADSGDENRTANRVTMKSMGTTLPSMEKWKGKSKMEELKSPVRQEKTTRTKVGRASSGSTSTQQKASVTVGQSKKALQAGTSQMVTSVKEQVELTEPNIPNRQALMLRSDLEITAPANVDNPGMRNSWQIVREQVCTENLAGAQARLFLPEPILDENFEVQDHLQGHFHEQVYVDQSSAPRPLSESTVVFHRSTSSPQDRVKTQIPVISPTLSDTNVEMRNVIGETMNIKLDMLSPAKTVQMIDGPLGLQWVPQFYSNYVQLRVVPGRQEQWDPCGRGTETLEPSGRLSEFRKLGCKESILERRSTSKRLMDVRLGELPAWLADRRYSPKMIPEFIEKAWGRYYAKYINVKKGGAGGLSMLLAGYCLLSYSWNYSHIKQDRWRKYH